MINKKPIELTKQFAQTAIKVDTKSLAWTGGLIIASIAAPALLAHTPGNQWITGTIVNAILFLAALKISPVNALLVAALPSSIALSRGLLPAPMAMLIPYIIFSNFLLILVFQTFLKIKSNQLVVGAILASIVKFSFLFGITLFFASKLNSTLIMMFQWPQLATALAGGLVAVGAFSLVQKIRGNKKEA